MSSDSLHIHPTAVVDSSAAVGPGTRIWHFAQIREGASIGANCVIGKDVYIDKNVRVGDGVKIQNGVSVYEGVTLEDGVFLGPYCSFTNDLYPRSFSKEWKLIPTLIKRGASVGSNATILCGVTLGQYSMVAAGAVLSEDTLPFGLYVGSPGRLKGFVSRAGHEMRLALDEHGSLVYECAETGERLRISFDLENR
jgi:UDP-2-acetamido-3-amino-2,3-dideoxy-glucuronate N-acetyltransferase